MEVGEGRDIRFKEGWGEWSNTRINIINFCTILMLKYK